MKQRVFIKASRERQTKNWKNIILRPEIAERHGNTICPQSAFFIQKIEKNDFMEERHKYAQRKKRESSEKRAVLKELPNHATQKT